MHVVVVRLSRAQQVRVPTPPTSQAYSWEAIR